MVVAAGDLRCFWGWFLMLFDGCYVGLLGGCQVGSKDFDIDGFW